MMGRNGESRRWIILALLGIGFVAASAVTVASGGIIVFGVAVVLGMAVCEAALGRDIGLSIYGPNRNMESTKRQFVHLFDLARWEVRVISGSLREDLYDKPPVRDAIERAITRGIHIDVLVVGPGVNKNIEDCGHWLQRGKTSGAVSFWHVPVEDAPHIVVVDGTHIRIENKHKHNHKGDRRKAICRYYSPVLAAQGNDILDGILRQEHV